MQDWTLGFTALRIAKLFAESTDEKYCCTEISRHLGVAEQTAWNALQSMKKAQIVHTKKEGISQRVFYHFTDLGFYKAISALSAVRFAREQSDQAL